MQRTENLRRNWKFEASFVGSLQGFQTSLQRLKLVITPVCTDTVGSRGSGSGVTVLQGTAHPSLAMMFLLEELSGFRLYKALLSRFYACLKHQKPPPGFISL